MKLDLLFGWVLIYVIRYNIINIILIINRLKINEFTYLDNSVLPIAWLVVYQPCNVFEGYNSLKKICLRFPRLGCGL